MLLELPSTKVDAKKEILSQYNADERHDTKMLLSSGSICDYHGNVYILDSVIEAEKRVIAKSLEELELNRRTDHRKDSSQSFRSSKSYLPIEGSQKFVSLVQSLIWDSSNGDNIQTIQTPGGTASIRMAAETIKRIHQKNNIS